jgi:glyoxylase-like metal-dependent hydrolase (beta-lactamase superfamily II)
MDPGAVEAVDCGDVADVYYTDTRMYDVDGYGAVYIVDAERPAVVETGIGTNHEYVLGAIEACGIDHDELAVIAPTHVHLDHAGGAGFLADACPNAEVYVHEIGAKHLVDPTALIEGTKRAVGDQWQHYVEPTPVPAERVVEVTDGDRIDLGDRELVAHHTPGHAPHQVVFESPADDAVYTADAAGIYVPQRDSVEPTTPPANFDLEQALADIDTIEQLHPEVLLYTHYGPRETGTLLKEYRETLVTWVERIVALREKLPSDDAVVEQLVEETETEAIWGAQKATAETAMNVRGVLQSLDR